MVGVSYLIRKNMDESPVFAKAKKEGTTSTNPLKESFGNRYNLKFVLLALIWSYNGTRCCLVHWTILCYEFYENSNEY